MRFFLALFLVLLFSGCAPKLSVDMEELNSDKLSSALMSLSSSVSHKEAVSVATTSYEVSRALEKRFKRDFSPMVHNFLVNIGAKEAGLCYEYADELLEALRKLEPRTLNIYRVVSKKGEYFEHNALLATSKEGVQKGVIIDPWRSADPLFWISLGKDRYNWTIIKM